MPRTGNIVWRDITPQGSSNSRTFYTSIHLNNPSLNDKLEIWIYRGHFLYPQGWCIKCPQLSIDIDVLYAHPNNSYEAAREAVDLVRNRATLIVESILKACYDGN